MRRRARAALVALLAGASGILSPVARGADEKPRPTQPAVEVIEAKDKEIKIQEVRDLITRRLHVEETAGEPVDLLKGSVRLFGPDGARIEAGCKIAGKECQNGASLSALGSAPIELVAKLPRLGVYTGSLTLVWSKKKQWYSIELTRALAPPGIDVIVPAAIAGEGGSAQIQLKLRETSGRTLEKLVPRLEAILCKTNDAPALHTTGQEAKVDAVTVEPLGSTDVTLMVQKLPSAGECTAEIVLPVDGSDPVRKPVTILLRRSFWCGVSLIALSVIVSSILRIVFSVRLPARPLQRRLLLSLRRLESLRSSRAPFDAEETRAIEATHDALRRAYEGLQFGISKPREDDVAAIEKKVDPILGLYLRVRRARRVLRDLPEQDLAEIDGPLGVAAEAIHADKKAAELDQIAARLEEAVKKVAEALDSQVRKPLSDLRADVNKQLPAMKNRLRPVLEKIDEAEQARRAEQHARADEILGAALLLYARTLAGALRESMPAEAPAGFQGAKEAWRALRAETTQALQKIEAATDGAQAAKDYQAAQGAYLRRLTEALSIKAATLDAKLTKRKEMLGDEKYAEFRAIHEQLKAKLEATIKSVEGGDLPGAAGAYNEAASAYRDLDATLRSAGEVMDEAQQREPAPSGLAGHFQAFFRRAESVPSPLPQVADFDRATYRAEIGMSFVLLIVAVLAGIKALSLHAPIWGTDADILVAVLWGLGLHQISGIAVTGIAGLRKNFDP